jgi:hypothetical protein
MEQYKIIALVVSLSFFFGYLIPIVKIYGVQKSWSNSYYCLPKNWRWTFTAFCWGFGIPIFILVPTPLIFAAMFGLMMVGASPDYLMQLEDKLLKRVGKPDTYTHFGGAIAAILFSQLSLIFEQDLAWLSYLTVAVLIIVGIFVKKNKLWYVESTAVIPIFYIMFKSLYS